MRSNDERLLLGKSSKRLAQDHLERYRFACQYVQNKRCLDIACGTGYGAPLLVEAGAEYYVGVDIDEESVRHAEQRYSSKKASFVVGSICDYKAEEYYDVIICYETIEHVARYQAALRNLFSLLRPGGLLLISSPNRPITSPRALQINDKPSNRFHTQEFTPSELLHELFAVGFSASEKEIYGQRQRWLYRYARIQSIIRLIRCPDIFAFVSSAEAKTVKNNTPRYFIIKAEKRSEYAN